MKRLLTRYGFTLLEVMVAVVILAIGLSSLFTSEAGAIRIAQRARTTTIASMLARCKMAEIEEKIAKEGWPGTNLDERDECCKEGEHDGFTCEWKVERIKLPDLNGDGGVGSDDDDDSDDDKGGKSAPKDHGMLDRLAELNKQDPKDRLGTVTDMLSGGAGRSEFSGSSDGGMIQESTLDPMSQMVMGLAFPLMKPVIEEGVRRATVDVVWKEGQKEERLSVVQFLVTEQQIILPDDDDSDGGVGSATGTTGAAGTTTTTPATTTTTPATGTTR